ncbi:MAG: DNA polymerase III subunit delta', partial [Desulforhopalus sp.]
DGNYRHKKIYILTNIDFLFPMVGDTHHCFTRLLGQEKAKRLLRRALAAGRLPHAYIFRGPDGVGKRLFARGVATAVNCRDTTMVDACGECLSCRKFRSMNHPDFLVIQPEKGVIKIDQVRRMVRELSFPPYESAMRVVVLEDVHTMRREAANSLLKTLEEPPDGNLLILTAESSQEVLPTLSSRCQVVPFYSLSLKDTAAILVQQGVDVDAAPLLARLAEGSPGRALVYQQTDMVRLWREVIHFLSDPDVDTDRDVGRLLQFAERMALLKDELPALLGLLKIWVRDRLVDNPGQEISAGSREAAGKSGRSEDLFDQLQAIKRAEVELSRNCNKTLVCEVLLFKLQGFRFA